MSRGNYVALRSAPARQCAFCGNEFQPKQHNQKACTTQCGKRAWEAARPEYRREWWQANVARRLSYQRSEDRKAAKRAYDREHREAKRAYGREWRERNRVRDRESGRRRILGQWPEELRPLRALLLELNIAIREKPE